MNARLVGLAVALAAIVGCYESANSYGQNTTRPAPRELPSRASEPGRSERISSTGPMTLDQVQQLVHAGLDDQIIGRVVRERGLNRPLSVDDMLMLRQNGVSNELIGELQQSGTTPAKYAPTIATTPAVTTPTTVATPVVTSPTVVEVREPAPVIVRTVPHYYYAPPPRVYVHAPYCYPHFHGHYYGHGHHHHHGGRISFGFAF